MIDFNHLDNLLDKGRELNSDEIRRTCELLLDPGADDARKAEILAKLNHKGETAAEIAGFAREFRKIAVDPGIRPEECGGVLIDVCGTGADRLNTFNISTAVMFVVAGGGVSVAKHGNRSITSQCGGADVLEALGCKIDLPPDKLRESLVKHGLAFFFAPLFHPAFKQIAPVRKMLAAKGYHSIFNFLGPLLNPAPINCQLVGLSNPALLEKYAHTLHLLGRQKAWVVHGRIDAEKSQGMDEVSLFGPTQIARVDGGQVSVEELDFRAFLPGQSGMESLQGGDAAKNAAIITGLLQGHEKGSPREQIVLANAAAAFVVAGKAGSIEQGITLAEASIHSGRACQKLEALCAT
ncbi:anthranilate phosphoribosyltransferase [Kamptonema cortianum]|nr:anthranilate phosphoribosyltransferase [Kamptonema cortianum]MDL5050087.1 anthranilate phosphoribosyltransferase [Oscillatoria amoena NRMC-F 0135]